MTVYAFDIDGTIDADPYLYEQLMGAIVAKGDRVFIITGVPSFTVAPADVDAKQTYLASMGITPALYSDLIVLPLDPGGDTGHSLGKAQALVDNAIECLFDNSKANIKAAAAVGVLTFYVWNSRTA